MCMFCISLFGHLSFFFWPLCYLFFFDLRILMTPLVSSNSSFDNDKDCRLSARIIHVDCSDVDEDCLHVDEDCLDVDEDCLDVDEDCSDVDEDCSDVDEDCSDVDEDCLHVDEDCLHVFLHVVSFSR
jgi:hypothetical protein